jgi:drug/metabolite transporter (DMT)-like permease
VSGWFEAIFEGLQSRERDDGRRLEDVMTPRYTPLIVGGLIPALLYGFAGVFQKWSAREGGSVATYLIGFGLATVVVGVASRFFLSEAPGSSASLGLALLGGLAFAIGAGLISLALIRFDAPISQLSPLYNMNLLVTIALGLLFFSEFKDVQAPRLILGALLVLAGGWIVSSA